jgi:hypothetical protein
VKTHSVTISCSQLSPQLEEQIAASPKAIARASSIRPRQNPSLIIIMIIMIIMRRIHILHSIVANDSQPANRENANLR